MEDRVTQGVSPCKEMGHQSLLLEGVLDPKLEALTGVGLCARSVIAKQRPGRKVEGMGQSDGRCSWRENSKCIAPEAWRSLASLGISWLRVSL